MIKALLIASYLLSAHSWYPSDCCSGRDCEPVPCEELIEDKRGDYTYKNFIFLQDKKQVRPSQDSKCHVCLGFNSYGEKKVPMCVFVQQGS